MDDMSFRGAQRREIPKKIIVQAVFLGIPHSLRSFGITSVSDFSHSLKTQDIWHSNSEIIIFPMLAFLRSRTLSFRNAFTGWKYVLRTQRNAWIHAAISLVVIIMALWLRLPARDWALLIFAFALVWVAEAINTALEAVVNLASPQSHPLAKIGKDVSAGAVLIAACAAILIGLLVLGPPLWSRLALLWQIK
jgi:diacylglycerol kinase